jgi:hypothetical protein
MRKLGLALVVVVLVLACVLAVVGGPSDGLRAELNTENADIGIPGITKMYEARLTNRSRWPIRIQYCDFVDDAMAHGEEVAYTIERWDDVAQHWTTIVRANGKDFCRPYPLGIIRAKLTSRLLWPGQSISTGQEATAARDEFVIGDKARFVIFAAPARDRSAQLATAGFVIDQHPETDVPMRVRH